FGGWISAIRRAGELLDPVKDPALVARIREYTSSPARPKKLTPERGPDAVAAASQGATVEHDGYQLILGGSTNVYGRFINLRWLHHAPVNEQGVVFVFGMMCRELGYVVEIVKPGFPDAKPSAGLKVSRASGSGSVLSLNSQSRNFRAHGH